jgi:hypothetical protein
MKPRILLVAALAVAAGVAQAAPAAGPDDLKAAIHKLTQGGNYSWTVATSNEGETAERYSVGPLDGKTDKEGLTWIRTRETPPIEIVLKGQKMAVRMDEGWALENELASGAKVRGHANLSLLKNLKTHNRPAAQAAALLKHAKDLKEGTPGYFVSPLDDAGIKEFLHQSLRTKGTPEIDPLGGSVAFWIRDGVLLRYELTLRGTVTYPAPAASSWTADLKTTVEVSGVGATTVDVPDEARKKLE